MRHQSAYTVEEVTERVGITPRTLHYYEEIGLLGEVPRTEGGHRYYSSDMVEKLERILRLKDLLGVSLQNIRGILQAEDELERLRSSYYEEADGAEKERLLDEAMALLQQQIEIITGKMERLQTMKLGFEQRLQRAYGLKRDRTKDGEGNRNNE
jgi:DNA-binding transcriptional MerR regulator